MDIAFVTQAYRHSVQITPGAGAIVGGPCDAVICSAACTLTVELAEDPGAPVALVLLASVVYPLVCNKVTAISAGNVFALWQKNIPTNQG